MKIAESGVIYLGLLAEDGYPRYMLNDHWYMFYHRKDNGGLAIWSGDNKPIYSMADVVEMVTTQDFSRIRGFTSAYKEQFSAAMQAYLLVSVRELMEV